MTTTTQPDQRFYGLDTYVDRMGRFNFRFPTTWERFDIEGREGAMYVPDPNDLDTSLSAWVTELEHHVVAEDLPALQAGVAEGLAQLADCQVEAANDDVLSNLIKFERVITFREGDAVRKRKFWMLYVDKWLMVLTWQGSSPERYDYFYAMANYCFTTFQIPNELWFNTDRDLIGYRRERGDTIDEG